MKGRKPKFTQEEIDHMKSLYAKPGYSAAKVARLFRCSETTVLKAVEDKLTPKDKW